MLVWSCLVPWGPHMAIVACKECGGKVSSKAAKCPHCGAPSRKNGGCLPAVIVLAFCAVLAAVVQDVGTQRQQRDSADHEKASSPTPEPARATSPTPTAPNATSSGIPPMMARQSNPMPAPEPPATKAVVYDLSCEFNRLGMMEAVGEVENISKETFQSAWVLVGFYDARGRLVDSKDGLAKIQPLLPLQRAPFTIYGPTNPEVTTCRALSVKSGAFGPQVSFEVRSLPRPEPSSRTYQDPMKYYKCPDKEGTIVVQYRPCN